MKSFVLSLMMLMTVGITNGFAKINNKDSEQPYQHTEAQHPKHHKGKGDAHGKSAKVKKHRPNTVQSMPIKKNQVTYSVQTIRF